jgi:hypothetical protein
VADDQYRRWAAGRCPCCAGTVCEDEDRDGTVTDPKAIGEGVVVCGRCWARGHMDDGLGEAILEAIARRDDGPVDRLIDSVTPQSL